MTMLSTSVPKFISLTEQSRREEFNFQLFEDHSFAGAREIVAKNSCGSGVFPIT